ncbi:MAG TPA: sulfotransferase [Pseudonocardia sp.]|jgi:hypothetical protein
MTSTIALSAGALIDSARAKSGLTEFGDEWFTGPLEVLVRSLNTEAELSERGYQLTRRRLVALLVDRLRLRALQREHPEILDTPLDVAAVICGLPRTGSTLLHRLLAASPKLTSTLSWEVSFPIPIPGEGPNAAERKRRAREQAALFVQMSPHFGEIHTVSWDGPEEEVILIDRSFTSTSFESFYRVPSYGAWLREADQRPAYRELRQWLQVLRWQDPTRAGRRWLLKSPHHLSALDAVLDTFDDAHLVMTHRSPASAVPSYASMVATLTAQHSDAVDPLRIGPYWSDRFAANLRDFVAVRSAGAERFIDVRYPEMVADPAAQARRVLDGVGLAADAEDSAAFGAYLAENRTEGHGAHRYTPADFGLSPDQLERDFTFYTEAYL